MTNTVDRDKAAADYAAVTSPEYQAALAAQIDYDSTSEGQGLLEQALREATDPDSIRHLMARKVAGEQSGVARGEQVAMMPPILKRGAPGYKAFHAVAKARERLARAYGCAAAEANAWTKVSPVTHQEVFDLFAEIRGYEDELRKFSGEPQVIWRHPDLFTRSKETAPWLGSGKQRDVTVGDVMKLNALGLEAVYRDKKVYATGNPDAAFRWGYLAEVDGKVLIFTQAPDLREWDKARKREAR